jgi:hypothetical protein
MSSLSCGSSKGVVGLNQGAIADLMDNGASSRRDKSRQGVQPLVIKWPRSIMANPDSPQVQLERTYNAAADHYDHPASTMTEIIFQRKV